MSDSPFDHNPFAVYCAGETLDGTNISTHFVRITGLIFDERGRVRLTDEEAENLSIALRGAVEFNRRSDDD